MIERAHAFGGGKHLVGVYTASPASKGLPTVVLLTAGVLHRSGPFRLHVDLARRLAEHGFPSLRFDLSGIGDSLRAPAPLDDEEQPMADIEEALNLLKNQYRAQRFVLVGLCSGADYAHRYAVRDRTVAGCVFLDGLGYTTRGYYARHYTPRLLDPGKIGQFVMRNGRRLAGQLFGVPATSDRDLHPGNAVDVFERDFPPRTQAERDLQGLSGRGAHLLFVYTAGSGYFNGAPQFGEMFPSLAQSDAIEVIYNGHADHTYTVLEHRHQLFDQIEDFLSRRFQPEASVPPPSRRDPGGDRDEFVF